jgi:hypothetical protein
VEIRPGNQRTHSGADGIAVVEEGLLTIPKGLRPKPGHDDIAGRARLLAPCYELT